MFSWRWNDSYFLYWNHLCMHVFTMCALQVRWDCSLSRRHDALAGVKLSATHYLDVLDDTNSFWSCTWKHLPCGCHEAMCERLYFSTSFRNLCNFKGKTIEGPTVLSSSFIDAALDVILNSHAIVEANALTVLIEVSVFSMCYTSTFSTNNDVEKQADKTASGDLNLSFRDSVASSRHHRKRSIIRY